MLAERVHVLSFDVEHWYDGNLHRNWTYSGGDGDGRLAGEVEDLLNLLEQYKVRATFFILGEVVNTDPEAIRAIARRGHEVACHAQVHTMLPEMTPSIYLNDLNRCRKTLQDLTGQPCLGHRAPSWSIDRRVPWAVEALLQAGFDYDSSIFPMRTPLYGEPAAPTSPFWLADGSGARILELPPAVLRVGPVAFPYGGGFYWRVLPAWIIHMLLQATRESKVTYLHPWELNPVPAPVPGDLPLLRRLVLQFGTRRATRKLTSLLANIRFGPMHDLADRMRQRALPTFTLTGWNQRDRSDQIDGSPGADHLPGDHSPAAADRCDQREKEGTQTSATTTRTRPPEL